MFSLPPLPTWDALHPLIVHFPIALLLVAPLFVVFAIVLPRNKARGALLASFVIILLGTGSLIFAAETGEASSEHVIKTPQIQAILHDHEELAETAETIFGVITVLFAAVLFGPRLLRKEMSIRTFRMVLSVLLVVYAAGVLSLVNTAHAGGRLVHEFGVTSGQKATGALPVKQAENLGR